MATIVLIIVMLNWQGPLAQLVEHRTFNPGVEGSNPSRLTSRRPVRLVVRTVGFQPTNRSSILLQATIGEGRLAQLGEHLPYKQGVAGSSPATPTID